MRLWIVALLVVLAGIPVTVFAQEDCGLETCTPTPTLTPSETPTPTITPTPSNTPTPTPDLYLVWTLPAPTPEGTEEAAPGQAVAVVYTVTAGETMNAVLLFAIFVSLWVIFLIWLWRHK